MKMIVIIMLVMMLGGSIEAGAGVSLEQQRIDREIAAQRRHEIELEKIRAQAYIEAAKYEARA